MEMRRGSEEEGKWSWQFVASFTIRQLENLL